MDNLLKIETFIDHTNLKAEASSDDIEKLCREAIRYNFKTVCVNPVYIEHARKILQSSDVKIASVCGFPLGASRTEVKVYEAETSENSGAREIDMVSAVGAVKSSEWNLFGQDIAAVRKALVGSTALKVILECSLLDDTEIETAARIAVDSGADFVKTSTGFFGGATLAQVSLLYDTVGKKAGIKASGGIRDLKTVLAMIEAGASRIGTSSGAKIMEEYLQRNIRERP